jgi:hypothetical protein
MSGIRWQQDLEEPMSPVMATGNEVFGSCVEEIFVSVEIKNTGAWLCCRRKYLRFILV